MDEHRNTDNTWMETVAVIVHDDDGTTVGKIALHTCNDTFEMQWLGIDIQLNLYAAMLFFIEKKRIAYFIDKQLILI